MSHPDLKMETPVNIFEYYICIEGFAPFLSQYGQQKHATVDQYVVHC